MHGAVSAWREEIVMDERLVKRIRGVAQSSPQDIETGLLEMVSELGGAPLTVRRARDSLSAVLHKARAGTMQLIGRTPEEMTVVMSLKDLVELVGAAAKPRTFGEALDAMGFKPAVGHRVVVRRGRKRNPLTRYQKGDA
jgi:alkylated DNA nucleotide flippase Atl1